MIEATNIVLVCRVRPGLRDQERALDRALRRLARALRNHDERPWVDLGGEGG